MQSPSTVIAILFLSLGISARELRTIFDDDASTSLIHFTPAAPYSGLPPPPAGFSPPPSQVATPLSKRAASVDSADIAPSPGPSPPRAGPASPPPPIFIFDVWNDVFMGIQKMNQVGAVTVLALLSFWSGLASSLTGTSNIVTCSVGPLPGVGETGGCVFNNPAWFNIG